MDYKDLEEYACDVCGNIPDEEGCIEHGKGCFTQDEEGGGYSLVDLTHKEKGCTQAVKS